MGESKTFHDILGELEAASLDTAEKGNRFERLMQAYLTTDPEFAQIYEQVWLWMDYPGRDGRPDTGIDLVAKSWDGEFTAIQCKFFAPTTTVDKKMIDSFLAASSKVEFDQRLIISTSDKWGKNAEAAIGDLHPPVARLRAQDLANSPIDWSQFSLESPDKMVRVEQHGPRPYQQAANDDVIKGFESHDRGKLIMACGTGKTFTSLRLVEEFVPAGGSVLFLVPSISLLSQTVREWTAQAQRPMRSFAVCSDVKVGKHKKSDSEDISVTDLAFPATTDGERLAQKFFEFPDLTDENGFTAVFSTYQSIGAITEAQSRKHGHGIPEFDLIVCDEAHRTTGVTLEGEDESAFVQVHSDAHVEGKKRLYMTATPRVYGDVAQEKAKGAGAVLADMDDETLYGPEFHRLGFATAVEEGILTDYKVLVLAVDEGHVSRQYQSLLSSGESEIGLEDAAKLVGCWNGLAKRANPEHLDEFATDPEPMRRAVAFAGNIKNSKMIANSFNKVVEDEGTGMAPEGEADLHVQVRHVDGTQNVLVRNEALDWLKEDPGDGGCRILSNARCLSEGVDVPALDSVLFLAPRKSQVDVVQSVGRVMRKLEGKKYGYVILPIAVPADQKPEDALSNNEKYRVVWQVLQALRSHDERLNAVINKLDLTGPTAQTKISVIGVGGGVDEDDRGKNATETGEQLVMSFPNIDDWRDSIFARIVKQVGDRRYWETWAKDIADIAARYVTRITALIEGDDKKIRDEFEVFLKGLKDNLNPQVDEKQAVEMLAQHLITRPVFDALFDGYSFSEENPVSISMQKMLDLLDLERLDKETTDELNAFYKSVRLRAEGITDPAAKQEIVKDLYETFFRSAFKDMADRLGIVYTPVEIVDFILNSADQALREHFGKGITDEGVHVLDPFTGTGTFIVRLIQSGLIKPEDLERKFRYELHANEIVLLAYYVAAINIEEAFHGAVGGEYLPFDGIVLTDTFQMHEEDDQDELPGMERFPENNERVKKQKELPIRVIVGNPPYSIGQGSGNDDNQNLSYDSLDKRVSETYAALSRATNQRSLYDSYIRAIRLASDRIGPNGVICFVSNGGFIEGNTADGLRRSLLDEFDQISVFNLRGNQRTAGEQSRREGGKIFGSGSRATVAITLLVKSESNSDECLLRYRDIGDYLNREQKLSGIADAGSFGGLDLRSLSPNSDGDWINQRDPNFGRYGRLSARADGESVAVFQEHFNGLVTNRDAWAYGFSSPKVLGNIGATIQHYTEEIGRWEDAGRPQPIQSFLDKDPTRIAWTRGLRRSAERGIEADLSAEAIRVSSYRPFCKQWLYCDELLNEVQGRIPPLFPDEDTGNFGFYIVASGSGTHPFSVLAIDQIPDLNLWGSGGGHFVPRYTYIEQGKADNLLDVAEDDGSPYRRVDNITDEILVDYQSTYGERVTKDDIFFYVYGLLHSPDYRERFQADLKKMLPRIPKVTTAEDFFSFAAAGAKLASLHTGYESVEPWPLAIEEPADPDYRIKKMKFAKRGKEKDLSTIIYNDQITVAGIPTEAYRYMLGSRSAIEWVMDRYQVKTDKKSGIKNDPNDWSEEVGDPRYILDLLGRIVRVSIETMEIVDGLPSLEISAQVETGVES
ncbi:MAG TPA: DEAD/DEAH box helicase family protein [Solirubrobacterales bacterium]|nr:DEAD/DEAH box helicase family protein [Solirubrobacterales bacterium]